MNNSDKPRRPRSGKASDVRIRISHPKAAPSAIRDSRASSSRHVTLRSLSHNYGRHSQSVSFSETVERTIPDLSELLIAPEGDKEGNLGDSVFEAGPDLYSEIDESAPSQENQIEEDHAISVKNKTRLAQHWTRHRQEFLDEFIRTEAFPYDTSTCSLCGVDGANVRCQDCLGSHIHCAECVVKVHAALPFHRVQRWTNSFFDDISLKTLGLKVYLGHSGSRCPVPDTVPNFTVVDTSGVHNVALSFCGCVNAPQRRIQLLRALWFPATTDRPQTAFTFDYFNLFQLLNVQGKTSYYDYFAATKNQVDNNGLRDTKHSYEEGLMPVRMYRHIKMLKRAGRGHDPVGADNTQPGDCAVECPACPHPGRNLPKGWEEAPLNMKWLYAVILTIDANFRMKLKLKGVKDDPPLGDGWGHWVPSGPYKEYIKMYGYQVEPNLCGTNLSAADHASSTTSTVFKATGLGGVLCARHTLVRKNGMGDLQKGERFANMDFIVFSTLIATTIQMIVFSYDICCQWSRNLTSRMPQLPPYMQLPKKLVKRAKIVLPKMHIHNHAKKCQLNYNLNFLRWSAQSDCEDPERWWAHLNPLSMSTREMGEGSRNCTVDDHARAWNFRKIMKFGIKFSKQLNKAVYLFNKHQKLFEDFDRTFPTAITEKWDTMVQEWDADNTKLNPYEEPEDGPSIAEIQLELAKEEAEEMRDSDTVRPHEVSPSLFLQRGLVIEEAQRALRDAMSATGSTTSRKVDLLQRRSRLRHQINNWRDVQQVYMPCVSQLMDITPPASSSSLDRAETESLFLPSAIPACLRESGCIPGLAQKELRLRLAQADSALNHVRRNLRVSSTVLQFKQGQHQASQQLTRRTRVMVNTFHEKTVRCADRYIVAHAALTALDPMGAWNIRLRPLNKSRDLHLPRMEKDEETKQKRRDKGENVRELSWIWVAPRDGGRPAIIATADEVNDCMRCEWAKSKARADRWHEDIELSVEEMRRVLWFFDWRKKWWKDQAGQRTCESEVLRRGLDAYAAKQASIIAALAKSFACLWHPILVKNNLPKDWPADFVPQNPVESVLEAEAEIVSDIDDVDMEI